MKLNKGRGQLIVHNQDELSKNETLFMNYIKHYYQPGFRPPRNVASSKGALTKKGVMRKRSKAKTKKRRCKS